MRRKLFCYTLLIMAGIISGIILAEKSLFLLFAGICCLEKKHVMIRVWITAFAAGLILALSFQFQFTHGKYHQNSGSIVEMPVMATVLDVEKIGENNYRLIMETDGEKILASYYQNLRRPWELIGREISFYAAITLPDKAGNPRTFDYQCYLLTCGIEYICTIDCFFVKKHDPAIYYSIKSFVIEKREAFLALLDTSNSEDGVLRGLLFGDKNQMDEEVYDVFRKNGTAHVLAVSGLHVGILYSIYKWLYERWKNPCLTAGFLIFLFVYGTAALWSVSISRAIGLIMLVVLGRNLERRYDLLSALSAMALFSMIKNPYVIFSAGFQMSFLAVLSITFLQKPFATYVGENWAAAFAVQAGLLPYMAYTFNYISFVGIICNIPVIFLTSILVSVGMAGFLGFLFFGNIIPGLPQILEAVTNLMVWCNGLFAADGILAFDVVSPPLWLVICIYGMMFFCASEHFHIYFYRKDWKKLLVPVLLIIVCVIVGYMADQSPFDEAEVIFVDVGQGDCLHVKTRDGTQALIDGGGKFGYNIGEKTLKPYLLKNRISSVDLAAATHLHLDHYEGLKQLAACYPVKQMITEGQMGQKIILEEDYWLEILWPKVQNSDTDDENKNSLIFMVHHNGLKTLITGDITEEGEAMLLEAYKGTSKLQADILKVAHHGSAYSSSDSFLQEVKPKIAVISVGKNNYGHPSDIVIEKLEQKGIMVFRTDLDGAVGIINRKGNLSVCTEKQR